MSMDPVCNCALYCYGHYPSPDCTPPSYRYVDMYDTTQAQRDRRRQDNEQYERERLNRYARDYAGYGGVGRMWGGGRD